MTPEQNIDFVNKYEAAREQLRKDIESFPKAFGLRAFPQDVFRVGTKASFVGDSSESQIVVKRLDFSRGTGHYNWLDFSRRTVAEVRREITAIPSVFSYIYEQGWVDGGFEQAAAQRPSYEELEKIAAKLYIADQPSDRLTDEECDHVYTLAKKYGIGFEDDDDDESDE